MTDSNRTRHYKYLQQFQSQPHSLSHQWQENFWSFVPVAVFCVNFFQIWATFFICLFLITLFKKKIYSMCFGTATETYLWIKFESLSSSKFSFLICTKVKNETKIWHACDWRENVRLVLNRLWIFSYRLLLSCAWSFFLCIFSLFFF